jgi:hypothetical protein
VFLGFYVYSNTVWVQFFPVPNSVTWVYDTTGTSTVPTGYKLLEVTDGIFTAPQYALLMANAIPANTVGPYFYMPVIFIGI